MLNFIVWDFLEWGEFENSVYMYVYLSLLNYLVLCIIGRIYCFLKLFNVFIIWEIYDFNYF